MCSICFFFKISRVQYDSYSTDSGAQPITNDDNSLILTVNGEIYNHRILRKQLKGAPHIKTSSDCEVILHLVR